MIEQLTDDQLDNAIVVMMYVSCQSKEYDSLYYEFIRERISRDSK